MSETGVRVLGINAVLHDPSAALVLDGIVCAAAEEERFSRRYGLARLLDGWDRLLQEVSR